MDTEQNSRVKVQEGLASSRTILMSPLILGQLVLASPVTQTTVGSAGGATALPATPTGYVQFMIGNTQYVFPFYAIS